MLLADHNLWSKVEIQETPGIRVFQVLVVFGTGIDHKKLTWIRTGILLVGDVIPVDVKGLVNVLLLVTDVVIIENIWDSAAGGVLHEAGHSAVDASVVVQLLTLELSISGVLL